MSAAKKFRKQKLENTFDAARKLLIGELRKKPDVPDSDLSLWRSTYIRFGELAYDCITQALPDVTDQEMRTFAAKRSDALRFPVTVARRILICPERRQEILAEIDTECAETDLLRVPPAGRG
jgi:hypothetical protein